MSPTFSFKRCYVAGCGKRFTTPEAFAAHAKSAHPALARFLAAQLEGRKPW